MLNGRPPRLVIEMNPKNWEQVKEILDRVRRLDPAERSAFFETSGVSPEIRAEAESLLGLDEASRDFMSVSPTEFSKDLVADDEPLPALLGQRVGNYEITGELGMGGMGAVYLAERADGKFEQKVALKMLKREFNIGALRETFDREKDILSKLEHPNIARLLDAGSTADGVPFLVMEYVEGLPVDEFCKRENLSLQVRLKLFNKICDAVQFAHSNLIIHRDLKPSNILVNASGEPKLLDFGISKLLDAEDKTQMTAFGAMTPEYAAPEQIRGESVSTASDIYSLGVILFKVLTGSLPFDRKGKTSGELLRSITEDEPTAPSIAGTNYRRSQIADRKHFRGDLDNIILKALSKEPERRYETVEQFSADIWRFIDNRPVEARPATRTYRLSKFLKRNKIFVISSLLVILALVAGIAVAVWQARVADANAAAAIAEAENARIEQEKAEKVSEFMMRMISYANPSWYANGNRYGGETRVIDALNDIGSKIDTEFANQPDVLAELHHQLGEVYMARGDPGGSEKARQHFQRAIELRHSYYGYWHELVAKDLAYLYWSAPQPHTDRSVQMLSDAIVMMRSTNPQNLNLPYMLEDYFHRLTDEKYSTQRAMYLRHVPQPAPNDRLQAADQLYDEMMGLLRQHFAENDEPMINQECAGIQLKRKVNKLAEAEALSRACTSGKENLLTIKEQKNTSN